MDRFRFAGAECVGASMQQKQLDRSAVDGIPNDAKGVNAHVAPR